MLETATVVVEDTRTKRSFFIDPNSEKKHLVLSKKVLTSVRNGLKMGRVKGSIENFSWSLCKD